MLRIVVLFAIASCGAETAKPPAASPPASPRSSASPGSPAPASKAGAKVAPAGGSGCSLAAGKSRDTIEVDGETREYVLWVGSELAEPPAVVFAWHGFGGKPQYAGASLKPAQYWNDAIVVAPQGLPRTFDQFGDTARPGWQVHKGEHDDRDLKLFDALLARLTEQGCVDARRVYTTGFSNGGFWSNVLACHRSDVLAAAAPAGGGGPFVPPCGRTIPVMITHGTADDVVSFSMAEKTAAFWTEHDGCEPLEAPSDGCAAQTCKDDTRVQLCTHPGGHALPPEHAARTAEFLRGFTSPAKSGR